jgi:DNA-binding protein H-NS
MLDEENKAIEYWKTHMEILHWNTQLASEYYIKILLNLIDKQQKEIEELKDKFSDEKIRNIVIKRYREVIEKDYISRDKIKAKIEEVKDGTFDAKIVLQSLLEKE